jgi:hypothetical protein
MISKISIVGADDSICPQDLMDISHTFPFVEWGINLCPDPDQRPAYPSVEWLDELLQCKNLRLRGILHGHWESDILDGTASIKAERPDLWKAFRWLQVDIRQNHNYILTSLQQHPNKIIIQTDTIPAFKTNILLPKDKIFSCFNCGFSLFEGDLDLLFKETPKSYWVSLDGFTSDDNITMDLDRVYSFLRRVEHLVTNNLGRYLRHKV